MKIIILLFAILFGFGATVKKSVDDMNQISTRNEIKEYKHHGNLLPEVEIVAPQS
ncbi:hypothetical protein CLV24_103104 [Pontibacter ummariensis]|uniref:Uncharacterized protein n=1 Tax=Pontibacter ummariensis TaxID=1610492 RepID=A0A239CRJ7_9BACT|nr:hypothetical protein [Pontibacter ummariensis]PRY14867.1 hypothetical protein CLV24_103104 [Pontibacter ummariensis]SNS22717.1 hypothetical protein SAMN06296052_103209 [Pontibacter ummariensis]